MKNARLCPLVALALIASGCGSTATKTGTETSKTASRAVRFAECMRGHGVTKFPDPDAKGELTIETAVNGTGVNPDGAAWKTAIRTCKDLQPSGFTGHKRTPEQQSEGLAFARCVRAHGVADFPDPAAGEPLVNTNRIPSTDSAAGMSALNAAMQACGDLGPQP